MVRSRSQWCHDRNPYKSVDRKNLAVARRGEPTTAPAGIDPSAGSNDTQRRQTAKIVIARPASIAFTKPTRPTDTFTLVGNTIGLGPVKGFPLPQLSPCEAMQSD
ncbi:MAG TPA: hypothetical protein DDZ51_08870 [Planctomycetaceae bacterium]|nr:hypothetical protein [Planctomycetaceae bacterium]